MTEPFNSPEHVTSQPESQKTLQNIVDNNLWLQSALVEVKLKQHSNAERDNSASPTDLILDTGYNALYYGGQSWVRSLGQLADEARGTGTTIADTLTVLPAPDEATYLSNRWYAQQLGTGVGYMVPFALTHGGMKATGLSLAVRTEATIASTGKLFSGANGIRLVDGAITGFAADFLLRPVEAHEGNPWEVRAKNGLTGAAVMTTMTAGSLGLRQATRSMAAALVGEGAVKQTGRIAYDAGIGITSGLPAGAASAELHARIYENRGATAEEFTRSMYTFAWTGGVLSAAGAIGRDPKVLDARPTPEPAYRNHNQPKGLVGTTLETLNNYRYRAQWALRDGHTEARRATYAFLNEHDLRHPVRRLRDAMSTPEAPLPRPPLTAENNPIARFERELPEFFKTIEAKERLMDDTPDRRASYEIFKEMGEVRAQFATKLLEMWHGTPDKPGIKAFSDAELAAHGSTAGRVAQIRSALEQQGRPEHYNDASPLTEALIRLNPNEVEAQRSHVDVLNEVELARERFYGYDHNVMYDQMKMPRELAFKDHETSTPTTWMPNKRSSDIPDLYHGTMSGSLPLILQEGTMLPARELRLRGIAQKTGESALEQFGRNSISMTRDFNEAFAYHRHSPPSLTEHPIVFGISRDIGARMRPAGFLERGELLVDKLDVGKTLGTRLGLKGQDITHIFAPSAEIPSVERLLRLNRIQGVEVVSFNDMKSPEWIREPELLRMLTNE